MRTTRQTVDSDMYERKQGDGDYEAHYGEASYSLAGAIFLSFMLGRMWDMNFDRNTKLGKFLNDSEDEIKQAINDLVTECAFEAALAMERLYYAASVWKDRAIEAGYKPE